MIAFRTSSNSTDSHPSGITLEVKPAKSRLPGAEQVPARRHAPHDRRAASRLLTSS